jgi:hypothetical protein
MMVIVPVLEISMLGDTFIRRTVGAAFFGE